MPNRVQSLADDPTLALLIHWSEEDLAEDSLDAEASQTEVEEFKRSMNQNRLDTRHSSVLTAPIPPETLPVDLIEDLSVSHQESV